MKKITFEEVYAIAYVRESIEVIIESTINKYPMLAPHRLDIEQELLIRLSKAVNNYDHNTKCSIKTFARRVLEFAIKDVRKTYFSKKTINYRCCLEFNDFIVDTEMIFVDSAGKNELRMDIKSIISLLTPIQRQVCELIMSGESLTATANHLGIPLHAVRKNHIPEIREIFKKENLEKYLDY
jgi:RNA polymerase sigma factor (sigma-70 family)